MHNLLFCAHTLCMDYVTKTALLVSSSIGSKQLLGFADGQGQKSEQKHTTKNFAGFHNRLWLVISYGYMRNDQLRLDEGVNDYA